MTRYVVVGAGLGGLRSAQAIIEQDPSADVTVIGDEGRLPYNRPPLSKEFLAGSAAESELEFECAGVDVRWVDAEAIGLDLTDKRLGTTAGDFVFDRLVIATGRAAVRPGWVPVLPNIHLLRTIDDVQAFRAGVAPGSRVLIVGGGFIGAEVAATLISGGHAAAVTIVERALTLMPGLGPVLGERLTDYHRAHGVDVRTGVTLAAFEGDDRVTGAVLSDGSHIGADIVLVSLGTYARVDWLTSSGLQADSAMGVYCDEAGRASGREDVVAVGDVANWHHVLVHERVRVEHWSNAVEMAAHAVEVLTSGVATPFAPIPTLWSDQYDLKIKAAGFLRFVEEFRPRHAEDGRFAWDGMRGDQTIAGLVINDNKTFLRYRSEISRSLSAVTVRP